MPPPWSKVKEVFGRAGELRGEERQAYLTAACGTDAALRNEVERLLNFDQTEAATATVRYPPDTGTIFQPGEVLAGRFEVVRFLGRGGMAEVYEAADRQLGGHIAVKTVLSELLWHPRTREHFKREILMSRKVTHRNVCRVFDLVPDDALHGGTLAYTMELLEGETLAHWLKGRPRLPAAEALPTIRQMADGLSALHHEGIIHRDFKPGNVILVPVESGEPVVKITDFGLAKPSLPLPGQPAQSATVEIAGTPRYMAPEQLSGERIGPAADIYALGIVIYEMVTGERPFDAEDLVGNAIAKTQHPPTPPAEYAPDLDPAWQAMILQCLEVQPEKRPADVRQIVAGLSGAEGSVRPSSGMADSARSLPRPAPAGWRQFKAGGSESLLSLAASKKALAAVLLAAVLAFTWLYLSSRGSPPGGRIPDDKHVAILPFEAIGSDTETQALCDGLMETLTAKLGQFEEFDGKLAVVPASEIRAHGIKTAEEARRLFGVNLAVAGSVQRWDKRLHFAASVIDPLRNRQLSASTFDVSTSNIASLRDDAIRAVVGLLQLQVGNARPAQETPETDRPSAYVAYLEGRGYLQRYDIPGYVDRAAERFDTALQRDPDYALAYAGLGEALMWRAIRTNDKELQVRAIAMAERSVQISPDLVTPRVKLGQVLADAGRTADAVRELEKALDLQPSNAEAHRVLGEVFEAAGRMEEAKDSYEKAIGLRPTDWYARFLLGLFLTKQGRHSEAETVYKTALGFTPDNVVLLRNLAGVYFYSHRFSEARTLLEKSIQLHPSSQAYSGLGVVCYHEGDYQQAASALDMAVELDPRDHRSWGNLGDALHWIPGSEERSRVAYQRAIELAQEALQVTPNDHHLRANLAEYLAKTGHSGTGLAELEKIPASVRQGDYFRRRLALIYELAGERSRSLHEVAAARKEGTDLTEIETDPYLAELRRDPGWPTAAQR